VGTACKTQPTWDSGMHARTNPGRPCRLSPAAPCSSCQLELKVVCWFCEFNPDPATTVTRATGGVPAPARVGNHLRRNEREWRHGQRRLCIAQRCSARDGSHGCEPQRCAVGCVAAWLQKISWHQLNLNARINRSCHTTTLSPDGLKETGGTATDYCCPSLAAGLFSAFALPIWVCGCVQVNERQSIVVMHMGKVCTIPVAAHSKRSTDAPHRIPRNSNS